MKTLIAFVAVLATAPLGAQSAVAANSTPVPSAVQSAHELWRISSDYVLEAAEDMPESGYAVKPTPAVRSFGELILHVAGGHQLLCGIAMGEKEKDLGHPTSKADIIAALKSSVQYCERAYAISDAEAMQPATAFGLRRTRLHVLMMNAWHDNEHYGNVVTYMRLQGMVPPSSKPKP